MLLMTGLCNSELRALTLHDLDFKNGIVRVIDGKGGKSRSAPFPKTARETFAEYLASGVRPENLTENDLLFGTDADFRCRGTEYFGGDGLHVRKEYIWVKSTSMANLWIKFPKRL
ncbi:MAG: tyrosine-type recombinase/integrase [Clostridia bacterium]|nr:tyrosine-type recombinase/integrase [Clostridia bacterium]